MTFPPPTGKQPGNPWIATTVILGCLSAFLLILMIGLAGVAAHKGAFAAPRPGPTQTVTVTVTKADTTQADATQTLLDNCSTAFHQLATDAAKESDLFGQTTSIASEAVQAAGIGDVATLNSDTDQLNSVNDQINAITSDVGTIDGSACE